MTAHLELGHAGGAARSAGALGVGHLRGLASGRSEQVEGRSQRDASMRYDHASSIHDARASCDCKQCVVDCRGSTSRAATRSRGRCGERAPPGRRCRTRPTSRPAAQASLSVKLQVSGQTDGRKARSARCARISATASASAIRPGDEDPAGVEQPRVVARVADQHELQRQAARGGVAARRRAARRSPSPAPMAPITQTRRGRAGGAARMRAAAGAASSPSGRTDRRDAGKVPAQARRRRRPTGRRPCGRAARSAAERARSAATPIVLLESAAGIGDAGLAGGGVLGLAAIARGRRRPG